MMMSHSSKRMMNREQKILISELTEGRELASQLRNHLNPSSSSPETRQFLIQKILSSYENSLSLLLHNSNNNTTVTSPESPSSSIFPASTATSPRSEVSDRQDSKDVYKKRKTTTRWTAQVKICSGTGLEGSLDDGFFWRKYGQKDILGSHFPRGYYRCTHRHVQGCLATKQVQRSDADPSIFEVTYRGRHTCSQTSHSPALPSASSTKQVPNPTDPKKNRQKESEEKTKKPNGQEMLINFGTELKVKMEEDTSTDQTILPSFSFPRESVFGRENVEDNLFLDNCMLENNFMSSFTPTFISPATSESNYFSMSPCPMNSFVLGHTVQTPESDLTAEIISTPPSVDNSPLGDFIFSVARGDLDPNFQFDDLDDCF